MRYLGAAIVVLLASGCGAAAMEPAEYFAQLEAAAQRFGRAGADLGTQYEATLSDGLEALQGELDLNDPVQIEELAEQATALGISTTVDLLSAQADSYERFVSELRALRPPEVAMAAHVEALAAGDDALASLPSTIEAVRGIRSIDELGTAVTASRFGDARLRLGTACRALQSVAVGEGLTVDLGCPDR